MIVILSNKEDIHCNPVIEKLTASGEDFFRLNTDGLGTDYDVVLNVAPGRKRLFLKNRFNEKEIDLSNVKSVWERRPTSPSFDHLTNSNLKEVLEEELSELAWWLRTLPKTTRFLGHHSLDRSNENKIKQLEVADSICSQFDIGAVSILPTLVTNKRSFLSDFVSGSSGSEFFTIKPIGADGIVIDDTHEMVFWSTRVDRATVENFDEDSLLACPILIQPYQEKDSELRCTLVGESVISCEIRNEDLVSGEGKEDWRQGYAEPMPWHVINTPPAISKFCSRYAEQIGTNFGCFDFIKKPDGNYIFLECNPNGQWMWLEEEAGAPISDAIVEYLSDGSDK